MGYILFVGFLWRGFCGHLGVILAMTEDEDGTYQSEISWGCLGEGDGSPSKSLYSRSSKIVILWKSQNQENSQKFTDKNKGRQGRERKEGTRKGKGKETQMKRKGGRWTILDGATFWRLTCLVYL